MNKKMMAALAATTAALICVGAVSGSYAAEEARQVSPGFLTAEETLAEFKEMGPNSGLTLPDGVDWPQSPPPVLSDTEGLFEVGLIQSEATIYWLCAWEQTLVDGAAARNVQSQNEGRAMLESFASSDWFTGNDVDPDRAWRDTVLDPALGGDLTGVAADLASCGYFHANQ